MGQGESKSPTTTIISRRESRKTVSNISLPSSKSVQLTDKEKKKLQQLQQKAEAKKNRQSKLEEKEEEVKDPKDPKTTRERAATKIQAAVRGTIGRKRFKFKEERERKAAIKIQAIVRGWVCRRKYKGLKGRTVVARELHATERDYNRYLSLIIQIYINPLRMMDENDRPLLTVEEMKTIFSQVEVIYSYNSQFLVSLEYNVGKKWSYVQTVGDIFLTFVEFFRAPYKQFIMKYSEVTQALEICSKRSGVDAFFQKCKKRPECGNRDLCSLISMPFQRIPRYILLLKELLKYTYRSHDDFHYITLALQKMEALASSANEQIRSLEMTNAVLEIGKKFEPPIHNLVSPYRKFKREGELKCKKEHSNEKFYDATVFLFSDVVIITIKLTGKNALKNCVVLDCADRDGPEEGEVVSLRNSWDVVEPGDIPLSSSLNAERIEKQRFEFRVHSLNESVIFRANSQEIKDLWMGDVITEVNQLTENKLTSHPLWRSKASYGIASLRKKSLHRNRTLSQSKFDPNSITRKDSVNQKDSSIVRNDSVNQKEDSPVRKDSSMRKDSTAGAAVNAKHLTELAGVLAKKNAKSDSSRNNSIAESLPNPLSQPIANKNDGKYTTDNATNESTNNCAINESDNQSIIKSDTVILSSEDKSRISAVQKTLSGYLMSTNEIRPITTENGYKRKEIVVHEERKESPLTRPISLSTNHEEEIIIDREEQTEEELRREEDARKEAKGEVRKISDLAANLTQELAANLTSEVDEGLSKLTERLDINQLSSSLHSLHSSDPIAVSPSPSPSTPKPPPRPSPFVVDLEDLKLSRPFLAASPSSSPSSFIPISGGLLPHTTSERNEENFIPPSRRVLPLLNLDLSVVSPRRESPSPSFSPSLSPSNSYSSLPNGRWSSLFDSPKSRTSPNSDRASPLLGNMNKRVIGALRPSTSEEFMSPVSPRKSPSAGISPSGGYFAQHARVGHMARMSKYEASSSTTSSFSPSGMRRTPSASSDSGSESGDSSLSLWHQSTTSSVTSLPILLLPDLYLPRSISADAILYIPASYFSTFISMADDNITTSNNDDNDENENNKNNKINDNDIVDAEVLDILCSRFRSSSFSYVEDLLDYGFSQPNPSQL